MPKRNSKGRFVKGGRARRSGGGTTAIVIAGPRRSTARRTHHRKHRKHRRSSGGGGFSMKKILPLAGVTVAMAYALSPSGSPALKTAVDKIPGAKTFGAPAALGVACLAVDKFVKRNKWLKLAGIAGIVLAASKIGEQGSGFKWLGDDDVGDYDLSDDVEGDDDMGDIGDDE